MKEKWKKVITGVEAVQAFDSPVRGGVQKQDERYSAQGRIQPPSDGPPQHAQQHVSQYGHSASYYNGHPQATVSSPFVANTSQPRANPPLQYSTQPSPPQQQMQYSPQSSLPVADYSFTSAQPTYAAHPYTAPGCYVPEQAYQPMMSNHTFSDNTSQGPACGLQNRYETGPGFGNNHRTSYDPYNQTKADYTQSRSFTMVDYSQYQYEERPSQPNRSFTMPNAYGSREAYNHDCAMYRT